MQNTPARSLLPKWYAEDKFLFNEAIRCTSDTTENLTFARLFMTPTNKPHRDGNHMRVDFCNIDVPTAVHEHDLAEPPENLPEIVVRMFANINVTPRCVIDSTLCAQPQIASCLVDAFVEYGFSADRDLEDRVMCLKLSAVCEFGESARVHRCTCEDVGGLVACNARSFGYDVTGDVEWLEEKLRRQLSNPDLFSVWALSESGMTGEEIWCFAVVFTPVDRSARLSFVQVVGTLPDRRRQGLAHELMMHALAVVPVGSKVYLEAFEDGPERLYRKLGFETVGTVVSTECAYEPNADPPHVLDSK